MVQAVDLAVSISRRDVIMCKVQIFISIRTVTKTYRSTSVSVWSTRFVTLDIYQE